MSDEELGFGLKDLLKAGGKGLTKGLEKKLEKVRDDIKSDIRTEIKAGMIKMFIAGAVAVILGNFIFSKMGGGK
jgi:hypothetical protein